MTTVKNESSFSSEAIDYKSQMKSQHISFQKTGFFSKTILDYLAQKDEIKSFYGNFPDENGFENQLEKKATSFSLNSRTILVKSLKNQYKNCKIYEETTKNINLLQQYETFTITTGHQLNLFTGPLYFLYKILATINLCEELSAKFPSNNFVPMYWMATEDHDFDEINYFNFKGKKIQWNRKDGGAVGRFSTEGLTQVFEVFSNQLGDSRNAKQLKKIFSDGYLEHDNLTDATRFIVNELFGKYGLVIVDGDDKHLKRQFTPYIKEELVHQIAFKNVSETIAKFEQHYKVQVNPREINLFYLGDNLRERIIFKDDIYSVNNTDISWSKKELFLEIDKNPVNFSPNVIMRPLYQEVILPNLCYIGGGGEIAYWLELKAYFEAVNIPFPLLLLRNSIQVISEKQQQKLDKLHISPEELFLKQEQLIAKKVIENSEIEINFEEKLLFLKQQFKELKEIAKKTDISFENAINAQEKKQLKGLKTLEKRLIKAEKKRQQELVNRIILLQNELLPNQSLEERQRNFSEFYLEYGEKFIENIKKSLFPLQLEFTILNW